MIRALLLLAAVPIGAVTAQEAPIHVTVSAPNRAEFRVTRRPRHRERRRRVRHRPSCRQWHRDRSPEYRPGLGRSYVPKARVSVVDEKR
jgi:hypothetical protein